MEVHRALGRAGRARRERDQRRVLRGGRDVVEALRLARRARLDAILGARLKPGDLAQCRTGAAREVQLLGKPRVAERVRDLRLDDDVGQLLRAQERHRRDRDAARLHHREPTRGHPRRVRAAQQHAIARHQTQVVDEHVRDPPRVRCQVG
ncbi:MAG TPA: hypothetical protein VFT22_02335, partial [Kofleriaceae bacterium]|nr:hypothetical protein [Kofleriaceae bacterium]